MISWVLDKSDHQFTSEPTTSREPPRKRESSEGGCFREHATGEVIRLLSTTGFGIPRERIKMQCLVDSPHGSHDMGVCR